MGLSLLLVLIVSTVSHLTEGLGGPVKVSSQYLIVWLQYNQLQIQLQVDVENLSAEQKKVVDFAVVQLQGLEEGRCGKTLLRVENFSQQVISNARMRQRNC